MYKLYSILSISFLFLVASCTQKKYCYDCTTTRYEVVLTDNNYTKYETSKTVHCDQTPESIKIVEDLGTKSVKIFKEGNEVIEHMDTKCVPY